MNYNEEIDKIVADYQHPCDAEVPPGSYRRVMWEKYNTDLSNKRPAVQEEWQTEVILISKRVYDKNPFGLKSDPLPYPTSTDPNTGQVQDPALTCTGIWSTKIGYCFPNQQALADYVQSIGSTLQADNNWYGADLSKSSLFKNTNELAMYQLENSGATWTKNGPRVDARTCMRYNSVTNAATLIDFDSGGTRTAYLKHYEDQPCTFVGMRVNANADTSIPGIPIAMAVAAAALPSHAISGCLPISFGFPFTNISDSMVKAWNKTSHEFKLVFNGLAGQAAGVGDRIATVYDNLSVSMEEIGNAALAMSQMAIQTAWMTFTEVISAALNIVGGGWNMIKNFLPKVSIAGTQVDILELCTSPNGVATLQAAGRNKAEEMIDSIYSVIGSSYRYSVEYVKMTSRDLVDAITDFYDWCWCQLQMAGVALCKLLGELAQIWSMPPTVPNPVWAAIRAVREILMQIKPLDVILSGNFPGFTSADLYDQCIKKINKEREAVLTQVEALDKQIKDQYELRVKQLKEYKEALRKQAQYLRGMWEQRNEENDNKHEQNVKAAKDKTEESDQKISAWQRTKETLLKSIENIYKMGMKFLTELPIMSQINTFLGMAGAGVEQIVSIVQNARTGMDSMCEDFVDGCRALKDACKTIYNQVCTLSLSKVTQWVNKLLAIIGLNISFPGMSFCVPMISY